MPRAGANFWHSNRNNVVQTVQLPLVGLVVDLLRLHSSQLVFLPQFVSNIVCNFRFYWFVLPVGKLVRTTSQLQAIVLLLQSGQTVQMITAPMPEWSDLLACNEKPATLAVAVCSKRTQETKDKAK
eukprot:5567756-Amphidinium_carterae.1